MPMGKVHISLCDKEGPLAQDNERNYTNFRNLIQNQRLSIMGVDKDEEAMNLVKYQEAYDLSAKVIQIMSEVYDKLINETGI